MPISRDRLETALSLIKRDLKEGGDQWWWYTTGTFVKLSSDVGDPSLDSSKVIDDNLKIKCAIMDKQLERIKGDLGTLLTMLHQASWQKKMVRESHLGTEYNMYYGTALADAFITKYRSAYDTIAKAFRALAKYPDQAYGSFTDLRNEKYNDNILRVYGKDLAHLIQSCDWYDQMLKARDDIIHHNLKSSGFMHSRILFQITKWDKEEKRSVNLINIPEMMVNENLVDFELYAAVHVAYTFWLLEEFAKLGYDILQPIQFPNSKETKSGYLGLDVLKDSIERVLAAPQAK